MQPSEREKYFCVKTNDSRQLHVWCVQIRIHNEYNRTHNHSRTNTQNFTALIHCSLVCGYFSVEIIFRKGQHSVDIIIAQNDIHSFHSIPFHSATSFDFFRVTCLCVCLFFFAAASSTFSIMFIFFSQHQRYLYLYQILKFCTQILIKFLHFQNSW